MHPFDQDISCECQPGNPGGDTRISANWSINGIPNGGYLMALMANAALQQSSKKNAAIVTANFISPGAPEAARLAVEKIAASTQFERFEIRLSQGGKEKVRALATFVSDSLDCTVNRCESGPPELAPRSECIAIPEMPQFTLFDQVEVRLDPSCTAWMFGERTDRSEHRGWFRFRKDRPYDTPALLLAADAFPPPVFATQGPEAWVPTLELSVNIRKVPDSRWLRCVFRTRFITCGLLEEDGQIWDEDGELIAVSRQIAQFRPRAA